MTTTKTTEIKLPVKAYCINLKDRPERWETIKKNWEGLMPVERIDAVDRRAEKDGMRGVYESHLKIMNAYLTTEDYKNGHSLLILEDDAVPCRDFDTRLKKFWDFLPSDWQVFLPGFWPNQFSEWDKVNEFIHKAKKQVIGNHCWCVNAAYLPDVIQFFTSRPHRHLDEVMRELQLQFKMYIAIPSFAHQDGAWSDTSNQPTYTDPTRVYFKDIL